MDRDAVECIGVEGRAVSEVQVFAYIATGISGAQKRGSGGYICGVACIAFRSPISGNVNAEVWKKIHLRPNVEAPDNNFHVA